MTAEHQFRKSSFCGSNGACLEIADEANPELGLAFRRASQCGAAGACVEISDELAETTGSVWMRDSSGLTLEFGAAHFRVLIENIKAGRFSGDFSREGRLIE